MAAKGKEKQRGDHRQRPVQFRGLSTHYVAGDDIRISFRYPASSFTPGPEDKVKLYASSARERSVAVSSVGDSSEHRLCDGGLYKTGSVTLNTRQLRGRPPGSYVLLYGSHRLRSVLGKSEPFIICPQENFPSIQIRTPEDNAFIEKLRSHSPVLRGEECDDEEPSFSLVSGGGCSGEWELLEEEEGGSEAWSDVGEEESTAESEPEEWERSSNDRREERSEVGSGKGEGNEENCPTVKVVTLSEAVCKHVPQAEPEDSEGLGMFKSANRELKAKVLVLHDKLHGVSRERDHLQESLEDMGAQLSLVQHEKWKLKHKNKKLAEERHTLRDKNKELVRENAVLTQHCGKQVGQMSRYEAQLKALSVENEQLQHQLRRKVPKSTQQKEQPASASPAKTGREVKMGMQKPVIDVYVRDSDKSEDKRAPRKTNRTGEY